MVRHGFSDPPPPTPKRFLIGFRSLFFWPRPNNKQKKFFGFGPKNNDQNPMKEHLRVGVWGRGSSWRILSNLLAGASPPGFYQQDAKKLQFLPL